MSTVKDFVVKRNIPEPERQIYMDAAVDDPEPTGLPPGQPWGRKLEEEKALALLNVKYAEGQIAFLEVGLQLWRVKKIKGHGKFIRWIKEQKARGNLSFGYDAAYDRMRLAKQVMWLAKITTRGKEPRIPQIQRMVIFLHSNLDTAQDLCLKVNAEDAKELSKPETPSFGDLEASLNHFITGVDEKMKDYLTMNTEDRDKFRKLLRQGSQGNLARLDHALTFDNRYRLPKLVTRADMQLDEEEWEVSI